MTEFNELLSNESSELTDMFGGELASLASLVGKNEGAAKVASNELKKKSDFMTVTTACSMTANMDSILDDDTKFNQLSKNDKKNLLLIVNNWRGEWLSEKYNSNENGCRSWVKPLIDNIANLS